MQLGLLVMGADKHFLQRRERVRSMLIGERCLLRAYRTADATPLATLANDWNVVRWMTASFLYPYSFDNAKAWVDKASIEDPIDNFAIQVDGALAGGIGLQPHGGEFQGVAEFGYWLATMYWGRGLATEATCLLRDHAFGVRGLRRLQAHAFAPNGASARVLEKCGFRREAVLRDAMVDRDGAISDGWLFAQLQSDARSG